MHTRCGVRVLFCATLLLAMVSGSAFAQGAKVTPDNREGSNENADNPQARAQWFLRGRTVNGKPAPQLLHRAYQQKLNNRALHQQARQSQMRTANTQGAGGSTATSISPLFVQSSGTGASWTALGPAPSGTASVGDPNQDYGPAIGRTTVVLVDQSDTTGNTVYIGGAAGGLWKSTNAASSYVQNCNSVSISTAPYCAPNVTWTPLIDQQPTLTVGAMAIKPGNPTWLLVGTGEANNSVDSYYGLGFLLSQDGGTTWTLASSAKSADGTTTIDLHGLGTTQLAFSTENISAQNLTDSTVVATMAAASGGISVGAEFATVGTNTPRGIYFSRDGGQNWQRATVCDAQTWTPPSCPAASTPDSGSANSVVYNASSHLFYANIRYHGFYSSPDGQYWTRLAVQPGGTLLSTTACPATPYSASCPLYRGQIAVVPGRAGPNSKGEMYTFIVDVNDVDKGIYQTLDGGATWTALSTTGIDICGDGSNGACGTNQGSYNLTLLAVPNGTTATDVWAGAVNEYRCNVDPILNPTCSTKPFYNMTHTYGVCSGGAVGAFSHVHPDEHGIDFVQNKPAIVYFGNDGGVYRTLNGFDTATQTCGTSQPWVQFDNLSGTMGSMIQYVWFSQHPTDSSVLLGGTQDNGSMARNGSSPATTYGVSWQSVNNGDGGFNDINPTNPNEWFTSSPVGTSNVDIEQCINTSGISCTAKTFSTIVSSLGGDNAPFYMPYILDPQAANHLLAGTCRLWRIDRGATATSWLTPTQLTYNLDGFATQSTFACASTAVNQVSAIAAGGPCKGICNSGTNGTGNGSQAIYVGTAAGELFVTTAADSGAASWSNRSLGLDNTHNAGVTDSTGTPICDAAHRTATLAANPYACGYPISAVALDPADPTGQTAYVTVMGFNTGHVFKTTDAGANWTNLDGAAGGTGLPDNPADGVVVDPNTKGLVYVATDVGVFSSHTDPSDPALAVGTWTEVGPSSGTGMLPNVAATALRTFGTGASTRLRVSTYGRGIWEISIAPVPTFTLSVTTPAPATVGQSATITGTITLIKGYNYPIQISCANLDPSLTCSPAQQTVSAGATSFSIGISGTTAGTYTFNIVAVGGDPQAVTQQQPVSFTVQPAPDFTVATPAAITTAAGSSGTVNFNVQANSTFSGTVTATCTTLPSTSWNCSSPLPVTLAANGTANFSMTITPGAATAPATYSVTITVTSGSISHAVNASVQVLEAPDFTMSAPPPASTPAGLTATSSFDLTANTTFNSQYSNNGAITLNCYVSSLPSGTACSFSPSSSVTLAPSQKQTVTVSVTTTATTTPNSYPVTITASATGTAKPPVQFSVTVQAPSNAFELSGQTQFPSPNVKAGATLTGATINLRSSAYSGNVALTCSLGTACTVNPTSVPLTSGASVPVNLSINAFGLSAGSGNVTVIAKDASTTITSAPFAYNVTDYSVTAGTASPILPGGSTAATISLAALSGYTGTVNANCVAPAPLTCALSPVGPYSISGTAGVPVTATITGPGSSNTTSSGNYTVTVQTSDAGFATLAHNATVPVTVQDYKLTTTDTTGAAKTTATVTAGQSASFNVNVIAQAGGFTGNVTVDAATICSGLPLKSSCTLNGQSSGTVTLAAGQSATLAIQTTAATTAMIQPARPLSRPGAPLFAFWTMLPGAAGIVFVGKRRKRSVRILLALALLLIVGLTACGGGGGGSTTTPPPVPIPGTPAGSYVVTVTSSAGSGSTAMTRTVQVTLTVQ
jgi:hypothetical protein